jgi:hypothetical protein
MHIQGEKKPYREMWIRSIRSDFSTLLILDAGRPARALGVHCFKADTTNWTVESRSFVNDAQLFSMADNRSTFLTRRCCLQPLAVVREVDQLTCWYT